MSAEMKICSRCGKEINEAAIFCRFCSSNLDPKNDATKQNIGCGLLALIGIALLVWLFIGDTPEDGQFVSEQTKSQLAELQERESGMHCLSSWDGSNRATVTQVKAMLRNPDSFEHVETRITPLDSATGEHGLWMTYRAQNGFGGVNVERMYARINNATCGARILPDGPGSG